MYTYISSLALHQANTVNWQDEDLSNEVVSTLYTNYVKVYLVLHQSVLDRTIYVDMDELDESYKNYPGTLTELLVEIENLTLPTVDELPTSNLRYAIYNNAVRAEYKFMLGKMGVHLPENYPVEEFTDLTLSRTKYNTDPRVVHSNALVSVNGFYHSKDADRNYVYVIDGGTTAMKNKHTQVGLLDFSALGGVTEVRIDKENIHPLTEGTSLKDKLIFSVDADLTNKSALLVLGGYLVTPYEGVFHQSGDNTFILDMNRIPYLERLFESSKYLDLSSLELTESTINPNLIDVEQAYSDKVIKNYLTMSQSFIVVVDRPYLTIDKVALRSGGIPGKFTAHQEPLYPLRLAHGRMSEYWKINENTRWSVNVEDSYFRDYIMSYSPKDTQKSVTDNLVPESGFRHGPGYLIRIGGFSL